MFILFVLVEGAPDQAKLITKLNQIHELLQHKNKLDVKLRQELQETKDELENEKEKFEKELNERETRERSLKDSKEKLETQLIQMEKESYDLLQELSLFQVCISGTNVSLLSNSVRFECDCSTFTSLPRPQSAIR